MNFQGVVMNVADLNRSIDFYREVLEFHVAVPKGPIGCGERPGERPTSGRRLARVWEQSCGRSSPYRPASLRIGSRVR